MRKFKHILAVSVFAAITSQAAAQVDQVINKSVNFTLITGDKVSAIARGDGQLSGFRVTNAKGEEQITSLLSIAGQTYIIPDIAKPYVDSKVLDMELFNITKLYKSGFDDESNETLSIIVNYEDNTLRGRAAPRQFAATTMKAEIELIDSAVYSVDKAQAPTLFEQLIADDSIESVWLDSFVTTDKIEAAMSLSPTVPLTGVYGDYARDYDGTGVTVAILDSGYDREHPDLAGKVIAEKDFSYARNGVDDIDGHGTHVASTIAGSGHESGGQWVGVAPGADLIVGKVLNNGGSGSTSGILQGMQWAVEQGADIVNMSLGSSGTSCSGPLVDMVEALSDDALFVISAGNSFTKKTVGIPGCAPSALTVAAIDRHNDTASFSSRGPSPDGHSAKPDIASQGVNVVAAASGGTGELAYRALSGTSMAAPHVAGGAAIVKQARPDLSAQQIKDVLTSSVVKTAEHILEQGAGPMDVNRAIRQAIVAPANIELGQFNDENDDKVTRKVTLTNTSDHRVTMRLWLTLDGEDGHPLIPFRLAKLSKYFITLGAGQSREVAIKLDPSKALRDNAYGTITGRLIGKEIGFGRDKEQLNVPVSLWVEPPSATVTFDVIDRLGLPADSPSRVFIVNEEDDWGSYAVINDGLAEVNLEQGRYSFIAHVMTFDNEGDATGLVESATQMAMLKARVNGDRSITFDARQARKLKFSADDPLAPQGYAMGFSYLLDDNKLVNLGAQELAPDYVKNIYLWSRGYDNRFTSYVTTRAVAPETVLTTNSGMVLDYVNQSQALAFDGKGVAEVVHVPDGGYSTDWNEYDVEGKIALITNPYYLTFYMVKQAQEHGAVGVVFYRPGTQGRYKANLSGVPMLPAVTINAQQGEQLLAAVEGEGASITWSGTSPERSPYAYSLEFMNKGRIKSTRARFKHSDLEHIKSAYYSQQGELRRYFSDVMVNIQGSGDFYSTGSPQFIVAPAIRDEYFGAMNSAAWTNMVMPQATASSDGAFFDGPRLMTPGKSHTTSWFKAPKSQTLSTQGSPIASRDTNIMRFSFSTLGDGAGHDGAAGNMSASAYRVTLNGSVAQLDYGQLELPDHSSEVALELLYYPRGVGERSVSKDHLGSMIWGNYHFMTDVTAQGVQPVLMPRMDLPLSIDNTASARHAMTAVLEGVSDVAKYVPLDSVTLEYGYGQECLLDGVSAYSYCPTYTRFSPNDWQSAMVVEGEGGQWFATLPNDGEAGDFVHLRVTMQSVNGERAEQVIMRAYQLE